MSTWCSITGCRHHGIFGVAAVERSPHASHEGDDAVANLQGSVGGVNHLTGTLNAGDDGRVDIFAVGLIQAQDGFGVVHAGSVDADNHPSGPALRYGNVGHPEVFGFAGSMYDDCSHIAVECWLLVVIDSLFVS
jgi:hypothetical protein